MTTKLQGVLGLLAVGLWWQPEASAVPAAGDARQPVPAILERWAVSTDLETARRAYVATLVASDGGWAVGAAPAQAEIWLRHVDDGLRLEPAAADRAALLLARARWLMVPEPQPLAAIAAAGESLNEAYALRHDDPAMRARVAEAYAQWLERYGRRVLGRESAAGYDLAPDPARALEVYRELAAGDDRHAPVRHARERVAELTRPWLAVEIPHHFHPEVEALVVVHSRNTQTVRLVVRSLDVTVGDEALARLLAGGGQAPGAATTTAHEAAADITAGMAAVEVAQHTLAIGGVVVGGLPQATPWRIGQALAAGVYQVEAQADGLAASGWFMVSDLALVVARDGRAVHAWLTELESGRGVEAATVHVWQEREGAWIPAATTTTGTDGEARLELAPSASGGDAGSLLLAASGSRLAYVRLPQLERVREPTRLRGATMVTPPLAVRQGQRFAARGYLVHSGPLPASVPAQLVTVQGETVRPLELAVADDGVFALDFEVGDWLPGTYYLALDGVATAAPAAVLYVEGPATVGWRATVMWRDNGSAPQGWLPAHSAATGLLRVRMAATGQPVAGARFALWLAGDDTPIAEVLTDAEGNAEFRLQAFGSSADSRQPTSMIVRRLDGEAAGVWQQLPLVAAPAQSRVDLVLGHQLVSQGEELVARLQVVQPSTADGRVDGTLLVHRLAWQATYVHRKKGQEITGEAYRQLPERSFIGAAQSDYVLRSEGIREDLVGQWPLAVGTAAVDWAYRPQRPGHYRLTWLPTAATAAQPARASFWVGNPQLQQLDFRTEHTRLLTEQSVDHAQLRFLLLTPRSQRPLLRIAGASAIDSFTIHTPQERSWFDSLPLVGGHGLYLEAGHTGDGRFLADRVRSVGPAPAVTLTGIVTSHDAVPATSSVDLMLAGSGDDLATGAPAVARVWLWVQPPPVDARLADRWAALETGRAPASLPWTTRDSAMERPFYQPLGEVRAAGADRLSANYMASSSLPAGPPADTPALAMLSGVPLSGGRITHRFDRGQFPADWWLVAVVRSADGRMAQWHQALPPPDTQAVTLEMAPWLRVGDQAVLAAARLGGGSVTDVQVTVPSDWQVVEQHAVGGGSLRWRLSPTQVGGAELAVQSAAGTALRLRLPVVGSGLPASHRGVTPLLTGQSVAAAPGQELALGIHPLVRDWLNEALATSWGVGRWAVVFAGLQYREVWLRMGFSAAEIDAAVPAMGSTIRQVIAELSARQMPTGAWSLCAEGVDDPWLSAWIQWLLHTAVRSGFECDPAVLDGATERLLQIMASGRQPRLRAWLLHATTQRLLGGRQRHPNRIESRTLAQLVQERQQLDALSVALLLPTLQFLGLDDELAACRQIVVQRQAQVGKRPQSADGASWLSALAEDALLDYLTDDQANDAPDSRGVVRWIEHTLNAQPPYFEAAWAALPLARAVRQLDDWQADFRVMIERNGELWAERAVLPSAWLQQAVATRIALPDAGQPTWSVGVVPASAPLYLLQSAAAPASDSPAGDEWTLTILVQREVPTLLRGMTQVVLPWQPGMALQRGDVLQWSLEYCGASPLASGWIEIPLAAGFAMVADGRAGAEQPLVVWSDGRVPGVERSTTAVRVLHEGLPAGGGQQLVWRTESQHPGRFLQPALRAGDWSGRSFPVGAPPWQFEVVP
jgi:hypothetical protein